MTVCVNRRERQYCTRGKEETEGEGQSVAAGSTWMNRRRIDDRGRDDQGEWLSTMPKNHMAVTIVIVVVFL